MVLVVQFVIVVLLKVDAPDDSHDQQDQGRYGPTTQPDEHRLVDLDDRGRDGHVACQLVEGALHVAPGLADEERLVLVPEPGAGLVGHPLVVHHHEHDAAAVLQVEGAAEVAGQEAVLEADGGGDVGLGLTRGYT